MILSAAERHPWDNRAIASTVKSALDERLGASWHVAVGETLGFDVGFESRNLLYLYYGSLAVLAWKCGSVLKSEIKHKKSSTVRRK